MNSSRQKDYVEALEIIDQALLNQDWDENYLKEIRDMIQFIETASIKLPDEYEDKFLELKNRIDKL